MASSDKLDKDECTPDFHASYPRILFFVSPPQLGSSKPWIESISLSSDQSEQYTVLSAYRGNESLKNVPP
jgi:hypothetical protein